MIESAMQELLVLAQALVALLLGGLVGWEREAAEKWAGLRTHMLVSLAAFLFVKISTMIVAEVATARFPGAGGLVQTDPIRVVEAVVTGLAFLGAGTIFRDRQKNVARGLTTAASLLAVAPIGISVALDRYILAVGVTLLVVFVLRVVGKFEKRVFEN